VSGPIDGGFRCSAASEAADEPLAGTASTIRRWLLLEHAGPWGADALRDARLSDDDLRPVLLAADRELGIRVLLVRRPDRSRGEGVMVAAVSTSPPRPWIERAELADLSALTDHDLRPLAADATIGWPRTDRPIFVVCTQGRRDPCCAERGRPLAAALARLHPEATWESTHLGGDRFAGNLLVFPEGLCFGRVDPEHAASVMSAYLDGRIDLERFRGRTSQPMDAQAAEHALRLDGGWDRIDAVTLVALERDRKRTTATFATPRGRAVVVLERGADEPRPLTCHASTPSAPPRYRTLAIQI
jgi:hypothetical protein